MVIDLLFIAKACPCISWPILTVAEVVSIAVAVGEVMRARPMATEDHPLISLCLMAADSCI